MLSLIGTADMQVILLSDELHLDELQALDYILQGHQLVSFLTVVFAKSTHTNRLSYILSCTLNITLKSRKYLLLVDVKLLHLYFTIASLPYDTSLIKASQDLLYCRLEKQARMLGLALSLRSVEHC